jgi:hypothetical protein
MLNFKTINDKKVDLISLTQNPMSPLFIWNIY